MGRSKMFRTVLSLCLLAAVVSSFELTPDNWDSATAGKSVFIKFLAPWWGHCKSMKPAWDKLMDEFKDSKTALVADVDCTVHQDLCGKHGVQGYPTIKYGDPNNMEDYQGGRSYDDLSTCAMPTRRSPWRRPWLCPTPTSTPRSRRVRRSSLVPRTPSNPRSRSCRPRMRSS